MKMLPWQLAEIKYTFTLFTIYVNIYFYFHNFYGFSFKDNNYKL